jgi:hypothetical protein
MSENIVLQSNRSIHQSQSFVAPVKGSLRNNPSSSPSHPLKSSTTTNTTTRKALQDITNKTQATATTSNKNAINAPLKSVLSTSIAPLPSPSRPAPLGNKLPISNPSTKPPPVPIQYIQTKSIQAVPSIATLNKSSSLDDILFTDNDTLPRLDESKGDGINRRWDNEFAAMENDCELLGKAMPMGVTISVFNKNNRPKSPIPWESSVFSSSDNDHISDLVGDCDFDEIQDFALDL